MNYRFKWLARFFYCTLLLSACKKTDVTETFTPVVPAVVPDFISTLTINVEGFATDETGQALSGATVKGGTQTTTTDAFGYFSFSSVSFPKAAACITISKAGYFTGYRSFIPKAGATNFGRIQLLPKTIVGNLNSATGGTVSTFTNASIQLPANAAVLATNNSAYNGVIAVAAQWIDPTNNLTTHLTLPGDLRGINRAGNISSLQTFGMLAVELLGSAGEQLQLAPGKQATLRFPIPSSLRAVAPDSIPLWYFEPAKGFWIQEGSAVKTGTEYVGQVSHFTFWNCDAPFPVVNFSIQLVNEELKALTNTPVSIRINNSALTSQLAFTDTNGYVYGMIPANADCVLEVLNNCNQPIPAKVFQTATGDVQLGSVVVGLQQNGASFTGLVNKCNVTLVTKLEGSLFRKRCHFYG